MITFESFFKVFNTCERVLKSIISIEEFCQMGNIDINVVMKFETMRFCKPLKTEVRTIKRQLNRKPTFSSEVC